MALAERRHDPAHVPHARRPGLSDQGLYRRLDLALFELAGQETLYQRDLLALPLPEVGACS